MIGADFSFGDFLETFHFLRPLWLLVIFPGFLLTWYFLNQKKRALNWRGAISEDLLKYLVDTGNSGFASKWKTNSPWYIFFTAWVISSIALAGPTWEKLPQPVHQRQDALVIVLDLSLSMMAEDVKPSRIIRAKHKIQDILAQRTEGLTALIAYSGDAHIVSPLTDDNPTIANLAPALSPDMMPLFGSDPVAALLLARELLKNANVNQGKILLISDDISEQNIDDIGSSLANNGHELSILGIGTVDGAPIPTTNGFLKDNNENIIIVQLHRSRLEQLAKENNGRYTDISLGDEDIAFLLPHPDLNSDVNNNTRLTDRLFDQWQDRGSVLVLLLLPFALLAFRRGWILVLPLMIFEPNTSIAFEWDDLWQRPDQRGSVALNQGDAKTAAKLFQDKQWRATANYKAENYTEAEKNFKQSDSADGHYNRGNALAKAGKYDEAIEAYNSALEKHQNMEDAKFNKQLIEQLKQQQDQQEKQDKENKDQSEDQKKDNDQQDSDQKSEENSDQQKNDSEQQSDQQDQENKNDSAEQDKNNQDQNNKDQQKEQESDTQKEKEASEAQQKKDKTEAKQPPLSDTEQLDKQQQQAMEQWLRKIPDEPSGLLRRKFKYESRLRQQQSTNQQDQPKW